MELEKQEACLENQSMCTIETNHLFGIKYIVDRKHVTVMWK